MRRDFSTILTLIEAHALLHQVSRDVTMHGTVIATLDDYQAVRELVADLIADGVGVTVSKTIRETVEAVREIAHGDAAVTVSAVAKKLNLDKSAALRRVDVAIRGGFLRNDEDRKGRSARLVIDDPLPSGVDILPTVEALATRVAGLHG